MLLLAASQNLSGDWPLGPLAEHQSGGLAFQAVPRPYLALA